MSVTYKVALGQFEPKPLAVEQNFNTAVNFIREGASQGCRLVVLPEYHLTSWVPEHASFQEECIRSAKLLLKYQDLARQLNLDIVPGTICELDEGNKDGGMRNMCYFIAAGTGKLLCSYQKKNLWHTERQHLTAGKEPHRAFNLDIQHLEGSPVRAGLLVCWDLAFPEAFRALVNDGADIIIIPSWWHLDDAGSAGLALNPESERVLVESAVALRAFENTAAVVFCNSAGFSCVGLPFLGMCGKIGLGEQRLSVVDIDLGVLKSAEKVYKIREDLASEDWRY